MLERVHKNKEKMNDSSVSYAVEVFSANDVNRNAFTNQGSQHGIGRWSVLQWKMCFLFNFLLDFLSLQYSCLRFTLLCTVFSTKYQNFARRPTFQANWWMSKFRLFQNDFFKLKKWCLSRKTPKTLLAHQEAAQSSYGLFSSLYFRNPVGTYVM